MSKNVRQVWNEAGKPKTLIVKNSVKLDKGCCRIHSICTEPVFWGCQSRTLQWYKRSMDRLAFQRFEKVTKKTGKPSKHEYWLPYWNNKYIHTNNYKKTQTKERKRKGMEKTRSIPKVIKTIKHHKREVHFKTCKKEVICKMMR